ncbi:hypothetical protein [Nocardia fluminea]|uniref:hypothetical protein n=1 Tax=Nocardia fluminea TaxID=134984 RepID=UPI003D0D10CF
MTHGRVLATDKVIRQATVYRQVCRFDAFARESTGQIVVRTGTIGAIVLPSALCQRVVAEMAWPGPVILDTSSRRPVATMMTGPPPSYLRSSSTYAALSAVEAVLMPDGDEVLLPSPRDPGRRWLPFEPLDPYRPTAEVVVTAILACR